MPSKQEFDNLYSLLEKGQYGLVLKITEGSDDIDFLFSRLLALYALARFDDASELINKKFDIMRARLPLLIRVNMESLISANLFDDAEKRIEFYSTLPYESQEVEEMLQEYPKQIKEKQKEYYEGAKQLSPQEVADILKNSKDDAELISTMTLVTDENFNECKDPLLFLAKAGSTYSVRMYAFLTLVSRGYNEVITFSNKDDLLIRVTPEDYSRLTGNEDLRQLTFALQSHINDSSLVNIALSLYPIYYLYYFPESKDDEVKNVGCALDLVARDYMQVDDGLTLENIVGIWDANPDKVLSLIIKIKEASEKF